MLIPGIPLKIDGAARPGGRLPAIGEHTAEVLAELARSLSDLGRR